MDPIFQYSIGPFDAQDLTPQTQDVLDLALKQVSSFMNTSLLAWDNFRVGSEVQTLQAVNAGQFITYATAFPTIFTAFLVVISNGDYTANSARLEVYNPTRTGFTYYHAETSQGSGIATGAVGGAVRINYLAYGWY